MDLKLLLAVPSLRPKIKKICLQTRKFHFTREKVEQFSHTMSSKQPIPAQSAQQETFKNSLNSQNQSKGASWIDLYLPEKARPYARLARIDKPAGCWLFALPCFWSVALAADPGSLPDLKILTILGWWAVFIRGAGCTINDFFDRELDKKVERTKSRPLASGALTPGQGLWWFGLQLLLGLGILLQVNNLTLVLAVLHVLLIVVYPLMKRITYWPQAFLAGMVTWGAFLGSTATKGSRDFTISYPFYIATFFWNLMYDTIYAHQDKEDDAKAGVKSTALRFGDSAKMWITGFGIACISGLAIGGVGANIGWLYFMSLAIASCQLAWLIWTVDLSSPIDCGRTFVANQWFGAILFSGILLGRLFP